MNWTLLALMEINCSKFDIPERLHQGEKVEDQKFTPEEKIYRRFPENYLSVHPETGAKTVDAAAFRTDRMSCNREKYSESANDVLLDINGNHCFLCGIAELTVENIQSISLVHPEQPKTYALKVIHSPERCMYPHVEVFTFENTVSIDDINPKSIRRKIKEMYSGFSVIVKFPGVAV